MNKHSPGPWQMATSCSFRRIIDASGREIIGGAVQRSDGHPDLYFANGGYEGPDARLVLAAPELLEALADLVKAEEEYGDPSNAAVNESWLRARDLLHKVRGDAP